jgi:hypothetical protein
MLATCLIICVRTTCLSKLRPNGSINMNIVLFISSLLTLSKLGTLTCCPTSPLMKFSVCGRLLTVVKDIVAEITAKAFLSQYLLTIQRSSVFVPAASTAGAVTAPHRERALPSFTAHRQRGWTLRSVLCCCARSGDVTIGSTKHVTYTVTVRSFSFDNVENMFKH